MVLTLVPRGTPDGHSLGAEVVALADKDSKRPEDPRWRLEKGPCRLSDGAAIGLVPCEDLVEGKMPEDILWSGLDGLRNPDDGPRTPEDDGCRYGPPEADGCCGGALVAGEAEGELGKGFDGDVVGDEDEVKLEDDKGTNDEYDDENDVALVVVEDVKDVE